MAWPWSRPAPARWSLESQLLALSRKLDNLNLAIETLARLITLKETNIMALIDDLLTDVKQQATVIDGLEVLLKNLVANAADPVKLQAALDAVVTNTTRITADIAANTVAPPAPAPAPAPADAPTP